MEIYFFDKDIWSDGNIGTYSHNLNQILKLKDTLFTLRNSKPPFRAVLGVPHQAAIGEKKIAENWIKPNGDRGRDSDENAASYALVAYSLLCDLTIPCKLVIACHFTNHDPNKDNKSPYNQEIFSETSKYLVECHGAGARRKRDVEISSGVNKLGRPLEFGRRLAKIVDYRFKIAAQYRPGSSQAKTILKDREVDSRLALPALKTTSLGIAEKYGMPAYHVEAKPNFRINVIQHKSVTEDGQILGKLIAEVIKNL